MFIALTQPKDIEDQANSIFLDNSGVINTAQSILYRKSNSATRMRASFGETVSCSVIEGKHASPRAALPMRALLKTPFPSLFAELFKYGKEAEAQGQKKKFLFLRRAGEEKRRRRGGGLLPVHFASSNVIASTSTQSHHQQHLNSLFAMGSTINFHHHPNHCDKIAPDRHQTQQITARHLGLRACKTSFDKIRGLMGPKTRSSCN
jgi:hypothetical protein